MDRQRVDKWKRWISKPIRNEVVEAHYRRHVWQRVSDGLDRHADELPDSLWWRFMRDTYAVTQATTVRRQVYADSDAHSLGRLVLEISTAPPITRDYWFGLWAEGPDREHKIRHVALPMWNEHYGGGEVFDRSIAEADLASLREDCGRVVQHVDRYIAHADRRPVAAEEIATLGDVHAAIDRLGHYFKKYSNLLTAAGWDSLVPVFAGDPDWMRVFRVPWIPDATPE